MKDKNTFAAEGRAVVVLQPVAREGRTARWLAAQAGCAHGKVFLRPKCWDGGQPHGVNRCRSKSDQRSIFAVSDKDCSQMLGEH